ncbi:MAG: hypothetical protein EGQ73_01560 [Clostridiales bacterium]|nr:hypothetical protein [Clostridiales bacterium]
MPVARNLWRRAFTFFQIRAQIPSNIKIGLKSRKIIIKFKFKNTKTSCTFVKSLLKLSEIFF